MSETQKEPQPGGWSQELSDLLESMGVQLEESKTTDEPKKSEIRIFALRHDRDSMYWQEVYTFLQVLERQFCQDYGCSVTWNLYRLTEPEDEETPDQDSRPEDDISEDEVCRILDQAHIALILLSADALLSLYRSPVLSKAILARAQNNPASAHHFGLASTDPPYTRFIHVRSTPFVEKWPIPLLPKDRPLADLQNRDTVLVEVTYQLWSLLENCLGAHVDQKDEPPGFPDRDAGRD
jgi:hypothetical protein